MTYTEYNQLCKQETRQLDAALGGINSGEWSKDRVMSVLATASTEAVRRVMIEHMKFAGIFTGGRQLADWCYEDLKRRKNSVDIPPDNT